MQPMPNTPYPLEFWSIVTEMIPLFLFRGTSDIDPLTQAALVATMIALHLWSAALRGSPAVPDFPTGDEMATLWENHRRVLWWSTVEAHAEQVAGGDSDLLSLDTPDGRTLRYVVSESLEVQWTEIDWTEMEEVASECGLIGYSVSYLLLRGVIHRASRGCDVDDLPPF